MTQSTTGTTTVYSGKVSGLMGDFAKGIKAFKKNMADDDHDASMEATESRPTGSIIAPATPCTPIA